MLKAAERRVIYRNFFTGISPRGIGVGYPEGLNIWDASKHWIGRGARSQDPLGDAVIKLDLESPVGHVQELALTNITSNRGEPILEPLAYDTLNYLPK